MDALLRKTRFYATLYTTRLGWGSRRFSEISKEAIRHNDAGAVPPPERGLPAASRSTLPSALPRLEGRAPGPLRIHFWAPQRTPGANVILYDMMPALREEVRVAGLDWRIEVGAELPREAVGWLVCFKAVPSAAQIVGQPCKVFLICDQPEYFWSQLHEFDAVVATASRTLAALLVRGHERVAFIGESEPPEYLQFGAKNLAMPPALRGDVLLWHGGAYSLGPLHNLRPVLERLAETRAIRLHVISGQGQPVEERWGKLIVSYFPWSKAQLFASAAQARLGFVPARASLRNSWLKPGSRVRCLYSLGVPAIGDARVPDAAEFLGEFGGAVANSAHSWARLLAELWDSPEKLQTLATAGHAAVTRGHSSQQTARQWVRYFSLASPYTAAV